MSTNGKSTTRASTLIQPSEKIDALQKSLKERIRWLFTKDGTPALVAIIVGFFLTVFVDGALGVVLATIAGLLVLKAFGKLNIPTQPWQQLLMSVLPIIALVQSDPHVHTAHVRAGLLLHPHALIRYRIGESNNAGHSKTSSEAPPNRPSKADAIHPLNPMQGLHALQQVRHNRDGGPN